MPKNRREKVRVVLTGGHAGATAYALIEELRESKNVAWDISWIGPSKAIEGKGVPTFEGVVFPKIGVRFISITAGRIQRKFSFWTIPSLIKIPLGFFHALAILLRVRPRIILSFGGFAAYPVVIAGYLMHIPVILHEQTITVGRANKFSAIFARKIALARKESTEYFPKEKCVVVGNPVSKEILSVVSKKKIGIPPTIFVTGGSRGSEIINETIQNILPKLLAKYKIIHQTGINQFEKFKKLKEKLPQNIKDNYQIYGLIEPWNWYKLLNLADVIVSRAGANILSEIMIAKIPAILIPIPWAYGDEQMKNAL